MTVTVLYITVKKNHKEPTVILWLIVEFCMTSYFAFPLRYSASFAWGATSENDKCRKDSCSEI